LESKGIKSVVSRVLNLAEICPTITHDDVCQSLVESFLSAYNLKNDDVERLYIGEKEANHPEIKPYVDRLMDWNWRFGNTPPFSHQLEEVRFDWAVIDVNIHSNDGKISEIQIFSDALFPDLITLFMDHLKGKEYSKEGISLAMNEIRDQIQQNAKNSNLEGPNAPPDPCLQYIQEFETWLINVI